MTDPEVPREDVRALREKVQRYLIDQFGSVSIDRDDDFFVKRGSAVTYVRVQPWGDSSTLVKVWAILTTGVTLTPDVYRWVAVDGQAYYFGHARVVEDGDGLGRIQFEHTLLGDVLDADELSATMSGISSSSDDLDDELVARFGGTRFGS